MKQLNQACLSSFLKKIPLLLFLFVALNADCAPCPTPFAVGVIDSTLRNQSLSLVVTRNVFISSGSGIQITDDTLSIAQSPSHGTVTVLNDSTILYTPFPGFVGTDIYTYTVCNSCGNCTQGSVTIVVSAYCPAPTAVADYYTVYNNVPSTLPVTSNDQNPAGGPLTISILHSPAHGTATISGTSIGYTCSQPGYIGPDTFVYLEQDTCSGGPDTDSAFVYLNVITCQPLVTVPRTFSLQQQATLSENLDSIDTNVNGFGTVTITLLNSPKFGGTASASGSVITYTAGGVSTGSDTITYQICTACGCDTGYLIYNVTIKPCSAPVAEPDTVYAGYSPSCVNTFDITANDTIPINGGTLTVSLLSVPSFGAASIVNGVLHYTCTDSTQIGHIDHVRYSICNSCYCDTASVAIYITGYPCNGLPPVVYPDTAAVCLNFCTSIDVGANDYSPQNLIVTVHAITAAAAHGTATITSGTNIRYCPNTGFIGIDTFQYQACDNGTPSLCSTATVRVTVANCSAPPVILNTAGMPTDTLHVSVIEDSSTIYCFAYQQVDSPEVVITSIGGSIDTIYATSATPGTSPCLYIAPLSNSRTQQSVQVIICNEVPTCDTVEVIVTVIPVNHGPIAPTDTIYYNWGAPCSSVNALARDTDIDPGDYIVISSFTNSTANGGTITLTGGDSSFCYTADSSFTGVDTFSYLVCDDSGKCTTGHIVVIVPVLARDDEGTTKQDSAIYINVTGNDTKDSIAYVYFCSQPLHGSVQIDSGNIIKYTPVHDYPVDPISVDTNTLINGEDSFCYKLCEVVGVDTGCSSAEVYIMILPKAAFYIPQGISPNGDGVNDLFVIASANEFPLSQLLVYNRYGDEVWRNDGDGYQNNFDGTWKKNGQPLPDGSYWYIFKFNDGATADRMGYIVIQR